MKRKWFTLFALILLNMSMTHVVAQSADQVEDETIYWKVDKKPEFPGGKTALDRFVKNNLRHPVTIPGYNLYGRVVCEFVVNANGSVSDIEVVRSNYPAMNDEVLRVLREMPQWSPGLINDTPVRTRYTRPVNFHLP